MTERQSNPLGERYAAVASEALESLIGTNITPEIIQSIGEVISTTSFELVNVSEVAKLFAISRQRVYQLQSTNKMPDPAFRKYKGTRTLWLKEDIQVLHEERKKKQHKDIDHLKADD